MRSRIQKCILLGALLGTSAAWAATPTSAPVTNDAVLLRQRQEQAVQHPGQPGLPASTLTPEQRAKLQEASSKMQKEQSANYMRMSQLRREMEELGKAETLDEAAIRAKATEIGKIEGDLAMLRAKHYKELKGILPKEQFEQMQQVSRPQYQQRLNSIVDRTNALGTNRLSAPFTNGVATNRTAVPASNPSQLSKPASPAGKAPSAPQRR